MRTMICRQRGDCKYFVCCESEIKYPFLNYSLQKKQQQHYVSTLHTSVTHTGYPLNCETTVPVVLLLIRYPSVDNITAV